MACGCSSQEPIGTAARQVLDQFWPRGLNFPPVAPYVGTLVSRSDALSWLSWLEESQPQTFQAVHQSPTRVLQRVLFGQGAFAEERRKRCKRRGGGGGNGGDTDDLPSLNDCWNEEVYCRYADGRLVRKSRHCCMDDLGGVTCGEPCAGGMIAMTETDGLQ